MKRVLWTAGVILAAAAGLGQAAAPQLKEAVAQKAQVQMGAGAGGAAGGSDAQPVAVLLEQGVYQEETAGDLAGAAKTYSQIVSQASVTRGLVAQALCRLAAVQVKQKQMAEARQTIERLKTEYPEQKDLIAKAQGVMRGVAVTEPVVKRPATAEEKAEAAALLVEGWKLMQDRKFSEANWAFNNSLEKDITSAGYSAMGWALLNMNGTDGESQFQKALELDPKNAAALNGLGWFWKNAGRLETAVRYWEQAVEVDASATAAMSGLAQYAMDQGRYDEAAAWYEKWLKVDPENADANIGNNAAKGMQVVMKDATAAATEFLKDMDEGKVQESLPLALMNDPGKWAEILKAQREPLGKVLARKLDKSEVAASGGGGGGRGGGQGITGFGAMGGFGAAGGRGGGRGGGGFGRGFGPGGFGAQDATRATFQYITQFDHKKDVSEYVTLVKDNNGTWRISGYNMQTPQLGVDPLKAR